MLLTTSVTDHAHDRGGTGDEDEDGEGTDDEEERRRRRKARRAERDHNALLHRRVLNEDLTDLSPGICLRGQSNLNERLPFIQSVSRERKNL